MSGNDSAQELERELSLVCKEAAGSREGVFGPNSMTWRVARESALFLGAGRALLLQLAHPWVAHAIAQHSRALADPLGRFHRTFLVMFTMIFGTLEQALAASRRLHCRHAAVTDTLPTTAGPFAAGSSYCANEASALLWVYATLIETAVQAHDLLLPPLSTGERERYYTESRLLAALFGIPQERLPPNWKAFAAYTHSMLGSDVLTVTAEGGTIAEQMLKGHPHWLLAPSSYRALTASMLPQRRQKDFGLRSGQVERRLVEAAIASLRRIYPLLPERMRFVGPYHEANLRLAGKSPPDLLTQWANRLSIGQRTLKPDA
jgi:uncharacterized protein (DUF2236 family)